MVMEHFAKYYGMSQNMKAQRRQEINGEYGRNGILQGGLPFIMRAPPGSKHSVIPFVVILIRISATSHCRCAADV
jgi:hypothetical protein